MFEQTTLGSGLTEQTYAIKKLDENYFAEF